jgi:hypothetical protein
LQNRNRFLIRKQAGTRAARRGTLNPPESGKRLPAFGGFNAERSTLKERPSDWFDLVSSLQRYASRVGR